MEVQTPGQLRFLISLIGALVLIVGLASALILPRLFSEVPTSRTRTSADLVFHTFSIPTMNSDSETMTLGPDGNLWFFEQKADKIATMTPQVLFTEYHVPSPNDVIGPLTLGPDDNLWFAEASSNKIGRVTLSGAITEFPIPTLGSNSFSITHGGRTPVSGEKVRRT